MVYNRRVKMSRVNHRTALVAEGEPIRPTDVWISHGKVALGPKNGSPFKVKNPEGFKAKS